MVRAGRPDSSESSASVLELSIPDIRVCVNCDSVKYCFITARENGSVNGVRIDKWLWAARFFKTRSLATRACELGRIESNGVQAKAAREVRVGDRLQVKNDGGDFQVEVLA